MRKKMSHAGLLLAAWIMVGAGQALASGNFQIIINPGPSLAANQPALDAFNRAANEWSSQIASPFPVSVFINADLTDLGATNVIGQTAFTSSYDNQLNQPFDLVRNAMAARAALPGHSILGFLPTSATVTANTLYPNTFDNQHLGILRANQKALGILGPTDSTYNDPDGIIQFNSNFAFNYAPNVIDSSKMDFQTVAAHEIGHVLGFTSDVDDYDGDPTQTDDLTTLDLFRFNLNQKPTTALQFSTAPRELRPGTESVTSDSVTEYRMSTGLSQSYLPTTDGNQASHWKDDIQTGNFIGIMDPTLSFGQIETVGPADLWAMDMMGFDVVPEPAGIALLGIAAIGVLGRRRYSTSQVRVSRWPTATVTSR